MGTKNKQILLYYYLCLIVVEEKNQTNFVTEY